MTPPSGVVGRSIIFIKIFIGGGFNTATYRGFLKFDGVTTGVKNLTRIHFSPRNKHWRGDVARRIVGIRLHKNLTPQSTFARVTNDSITSVDNKITRLRETDLS